MVHPADTRFLYAVTGRGLYTGPERGARWEQWTRREDEIGGYPDGFVFRPSDPNSFHDRRPRCPGHLA